jgi:hypothetical protein
MAFSAFPSNWPPRGNWPAISGEIEAMWPVPSTMLSLRDPGANATKLASVMPTSGAPMMVTSSISSVSSSLSPPAPVRQPVRAPNRGAAPQ